MTCAQRLFAALLAVVVGTSVFEGAGAIYLGVGRAGGAYRVLLWEKGSQINACMADAWQTTSPAKEYRKFMYDKLREVAAQWSNGIGRAVQIVIYPDTRPGKKCHYLVKPLINCGATATEFIHAGTDAFERAKVSGKADLPRLYLNKPRGGPGELVISNCRFQWDTRRLDKTLKHEMGHILGLRHKHGFVKKPGLRQEPGVVQFGSFDDAYTIMSYERYSPRRDLTKNDLVDTYWAYARDCLLLVKTKSGRYVIVYQDRMTPDRKVTRKNARCWARGTRGKVQ